MSKWRKNKKYDKVKKKIVGKYWQPVLQIKCYVLKCQKIHKEIPFKEALAMK